MLRTQRSALKAFLYLGALASVACGDEPTDAEDAGHSQPDAIAERDAATPSGAIANPDDAARPDNARTDTASDDCFAPTQHLDAAYSGTLSGCACDPAADEDQCIQGVALVCTDGFWHAVEDGPCEPRVSTCPPGFFRQTPQSECSANQLTMTECTAQAGRAILDPGDGSVTRNGCPGGLDALGTIEAGAEGGLCCKATAASCAPQRVRPVGTCEPAPRYYWYGNGCWPLVGCDCTGEDCDRGFASMDECNDVFDGCIDYIKACGGFLGDTCTDDEFCAYRGVGGCGIVDASAVCQPRPSACDAVLDPVCGCDGQTYPNECTANRAGVGVVSFGACG